MHRHSSHSRLLGLLLRLRSNRVHALCLQMLNKEHEKAEDAQPIAIGS